jgi:drug/metabolite transporter (DMT)-like permease
VPEVLLWAVVPAPTYLFITMFIVFVLGVVGLLIRWRRSVGLARLQYRWLVAALVLVAIANSIWAVATLALSMDSNGPAFLLVVLTYLCVPISIAIAVLRYRLYEIDRLISRTIGWAVVTGVLVAVFALGVIGLQTVLAGFTQGETLAVAASTLIAFALFQPVRRRVQRAVDRRFDRARYDGERTAAAFAERLRDQVDLATLRQTLVATTDEAVRPVTAAVWLRTHPESSR